MTSDSGFEQGKELTFDYALIPYAGDWRQSGIYHEGMAFNNPFMAHTSASHPGVLPAYRGFLEISPSNVVLSTLKPGENGGAVLRVYEATGRPTKDVKIRLTEGVSEAEEVNLMEDPVRKLDVTDNTVHLDFRPFEIKTIRYNA